MAINMIVSAVKHPEDQQTLWPFVGDREITMAATRNFAGEFYEHAAASLWRANRHLTNGQADICPDLSLPNDPKHFLEVKSLRVRGQGLIYSERLAKDRAFERDHGVLLTYTLWIHRAEAGTCTRLFQLREMLASSTIMVLVIPHGRLAALCRTIEPKIANYRLGRLNRSTGTTSEPKAMPAYRLPWRELLRLSGADGGVPTYLTPPMVVLGYPVPSVPVYCRDPSLLPLPG